MTNQDMWEALDKHCDSVKCVECPLFSVSGTGSCYTNVSDEVLKDHYEVVFGKLTPDNVNHPAHYETGKFECIDVMVETQGEDAVKAYCLCAAFKYLYRHKRKNGLEDIKKARWYLDKYIELEERKAE